MRSSLILLVSAIAAFGQDAPAPGVQDTAAPAGVPSVPVIVVQALPMAPPDLNSPYASPRDGARRRFQATLSDLAVNRDLKEALRGFAQAYLDDPTYAEAAYNLGILAAIEEKWDDAVAALDEATRLDPRPLGLTAAPQLERLRLIASLERSAEGRRKRHYDEALLKLLNDLPVLTEENLKSALAELGQIDPKRWEAPALLAGLYGDGRGYETAAKFLEIATANATDPAVKSALATARDAAERELRYSSTRAAAEAAADSGDYPQAAELYQSAWNAIPARMVNGLDAASALLLSDDTAHASVLLARLREGGNPEVKGLAEGMLKQLDPIEPGAKASSSDASQFFRDPGPAEPARISILIPAIDRKPFEIYTRSLPKLVDDPEPVVLLASLSAEGSTTPPPVPALTQPLINGDSPWLELTALKSRPPAPSAPKPVREVQTADLAHDTVPAHVLQVTSDPAVARIFIPPSTDPTCETPCNLRLAGNAYAFRLVLQGYQDSEQAGELMADTQDLSIPLTLLRGIVIIETGPPATLRVNGNSLAGSESPAELSFAPGLYRVGVDFGSRINERLLMVRPGARLRLVLK